MSDDVMKTLLAVIVALALAGCSNIVLSNDPRDQLYPSFSLAYDGPIAYKNEKANYAEGDCVFDIKIDYPGSITRNSVIPMKCTGSSSESGLPWPPRGDLIVTWRATPNGELLRRQIDLAELGKLYQIKGGKVTIKLVRDKLQLYISEPDLRPGKCYDSGVCQKLPKKLIKEY